MSLNRHHLSWNTDRIVPGVPETAPPGTEIRLKRDRWGGKWDTGRGWRGISGQVGRKTGHWARFNGDFGTGGAENGTLGEVQRGFRDRWGGKWDTGRGSKDGSAGALGSYGWAAMRGAVGGRRFGGGTAGGDGWAAVREYAKDLALREGNIEYFHYFWKWEKGGQTAHM